MGQWLKGQTKHEGTTYRFEALVFEVGSKYGIDGGPVSKLWISAEAGERTWEAPCYAYERGLDLDEAPAGLVAKVLEVIAKTPKSWTGRSSWAWHPGREDTFPRD